MGYCSRVAIILPEHIYRKLLDKIIVLQDYDTRQEVYMLLNEAKIFQNNETKDVLLFWEDIKWYFVVLDDSDESYKEIVFIENFLRDLSDKDYAFLRIGEDAADREVFGDYSSPFEAYIEHNIHMNTDNSTRIATG